MSRRAPMLLAAIVLIVALFASVAYAATITGTDKSDVLYESQRNNTIEGGGGSDLLRAAKFPYDTDNLDGGSDVDTLNAADGDNRDRFDGGGGDWDKCKGDPLDDFDNCEIIER